MFRFALVLSVLVGCYSPSFQDCQFACTSLDTECPDGMSCVTGRCRAAGETGACRIGNDGGGDDAADDASIDTLPSDVTMGWGPAQLAPGLPAGISDPFLDTARTKMWMTFGGGISLSSFVSGTWSPPTLLMNLSGYVVPVLDSSLTTMFVYMPTTMVTFKTTYSGNLWMPPNQQPEIQSSFVPSSLPGTGLRLYGSIPFAGTLSDPATMSRPLPNGPFDTGPTVIPELSTTANESHPSVDATDTVMVFAADRMGGQGGYDLYISTRSTPSATWGAPVPFPGVNSAMDELDPWLAPDRTSLYFVRGMATQASRQVYFSLRAP